MGDFNDAPTDKSVIEYLKAYPPSKNIKKNEIYNLMYPLSLTKEGTHPYHGHWAVLDHMIVSSALLDEKNSIHTTLKSAYPFRAEFLLEEDKKYGGTKTNRSYIGFKYHGGYSDHLPVILDLFFK
jgi:endonuclease/exonuclease/phosphatase family metal-dependent hydrolase